MNDPIYRPNNQLLPHLYDEFNNLKEKLSFVETKINNTSWNKNMSGSKHTESVSLEKNIADLSLSLMKILHNEKKSRTLRPFILSIISEDERIFHPLRTSKFQLIHAESMSTKSEKEVLSQQQIAVFTIPMLYARTKVYNLTKEDKEEIERNKKSLDHVTPTMIRHCIPVATPNNFKESTKFFITDQAQGRTVPETYEFTYEFPFEKKTKRLLNLREWLDQQVIRVNHRTFTIEEIIKEVRNKIAAHQSVTLKIPKNSFLYNTKFMNFGYPYWFYFIFFCTYYIVFIVGKSLNKKDDAGIKIIDPFKSGATIHSVRPNMLSHEVFSHEELESFLVWSNNVSFAANTGLDSDFFQIPLLRVTFSNETEHKFFDIPLMVLVKMFSENEEEKSLSLYLHLKKNLCGFGLKFKSGADFVIYFIKNKDNTISQVGLKSYINLPITTISISMYNPHGTQ